MKKFLCMMLVFVMVLSTVAFAKPKEVEKVTIYHIDSPYENDRTLDTKADIGDSYGYRITNIAWDSPAVSRSGKYEVKVTLVANKEYVFAEEVTATVNEKAANSVTYDEKEEELYVTYVFTDEDKPRSTVSNENTRFSVSSYCNEKYGMISPAFAKVREREDATFKIIPNDGYKIKDVTVDGESVGAVSEYTLKKIEENHRISAYFEKVASNDEETAKSNNTKVEEPTVETPTKTPTTVPTTSNTDATPIFSFLMRLIQLLMGE